MKVIEIRNPATLKSLTLTERPEPEPGPGEICVRVRACSLNFHDYAAVAGMIPIADGRIPMSDGAGEVIAVGEGVDLFAVGDAVMSTFFPHWPGGPVSAARTLVAGTTDPVRRRWTCAELPGDAQRVADALLSRFEPGDRINVRAANCPE